MLGGDGPGEVHPALYVLLGVVGVLGGLIAFGLMGFVVGPVLLALFVTLLGLYIEEREAAGAATGPVPGPGEAGQPTDADAGEGADGGSS